MLHIVWGSRTLLPYTCVWIYGWYKENLQQESFYKSILYRSINPPSCYALLLFAAPPFHFIKSKDSHGSLKSRLSPLLPPPLSFFYVFNLSLDLQLLFFIHFMLTFFPVHPLLSKIIHFYFPASFVWLDSRVILGCVRSGMRRGLVLVGTVLVYLPTAILPAASLFLLHCDRLAKEKRYTCCLAARLSAVFVINMVLRLSQVLLLFFLLLPVCLDTSGCVA